MHPKTKPHVAVVGAGIGGLTAAVELAGHGCRVTLLERHTSVGGKVRQVSIHGRRIDVGPTVLTMKWVFDKIFGDVGRRFEDEVELIAADRVADHFWDDGSRLTLYTDPDRSASAIASFAGGREADAYLAFSDYAKRIYDNAYRTFMTSPDPGISHMARHAGLRALPAVLRIDAFRTMSAAINRFFEDERLRQLFARYATYLGASPYSAPATLNLIAHVEQQGVFLPVSGMASLASALERTAAARGCDIRLGAGVREIRTQRGRVIGVTLEDGAPLDADAVVFNGDVSALGMGLLGGGVRRGAAKTSPGKRSLSALVGAALVAAKGFPLSSHNVFFQRAPYRKEFTDIFDKGRLPASPTIYLRAQDRDNTDAPSDKERLFFIINAPPVGDVNPLTDEEIDRCLLSATRALHRAGLPISIDRASARVFSPNDFATRFPGTGGALYGRATHSMTASIRRSGVRSGIANLYLTGGSVHPGAGVPMAALGGWLLASTLLSDFGLTGPSPLMDTAGSTSTG